MEFESRVIEYTDEDGTILEGFVAIPKSNRPSPGVLIFHAFSGCTDFEKKKAEELAQLGFAGFAADLYGKGKRGTNFDENIALMTPLFNDRSVLLKKRMLAAMEALKALDGVSSDQIAAFGYCFGGMCALDLARFRVGIKAAISFHGTLFPLPDAPLEPLDAAIQVHNGDADFHIKKDVIEAFQQEMRDRDADWSFISYAKAKHAFTNPEADSSRPGIGYNHEADIRSWASAVALLNEKLK